MSVPQTSTSSAVLHRLHWRVRHAVENLLSGDYRSVFRGRGMEFDQVVKYEFGDDVRDLDWNVTARMGQPYRKRFIEEREVTVLILLEDTPSLRFGSGNFGAKRDVLLQLASMLMLLSAENRDRVGLIHATPNHYTFRPPVRGRNAILHYAAAMLASRSSPLDRGGAKIPWRLIMQAAPRHSIVIWLGDFAPRESPPGWASISRRYHTAGFRVVDPWEVTFPDGIALAAYDPTLGQVIAFEDTAGQREAHAEWGVARDRSWRALFPNALDRLTVKSDEDPLRGLVRFFHARANARQR